MTKDRVLVHFGSPQGVRYGLGEDEREEEQTDERD